jgi:hypothetical protein
VGRILGREQNLGSESEMGKMANKSIGKGQNQATQIQNQHLANKFRTKMQIFLKRKNSKKLDGQKLHLVGEVQLKLRCCCSKNWGKFSWSSPSQFGGPIFH